jgi:tetratricopeptide (TPR) repeat protein
MSFTKNIADCHALSKSQIAIEFAYRVRETLPHTWVFWVDAEDASSIKASFRKIAKALGLPGYDERNTDIMTPVRDWLNQDTNGSWVLVVDSADDPSVLTEHVHTQAQPAAGIDLPPVPQIREFFTSSQHGSVLITSTNNEAAQLLTGNFAHHIEVEEMNESEALALLKSKLHSKVTYNEDEAKELVKAAEYMPLAISQTAGQISMDYPKFNLAQAIAKLNNPDEDTTRFLEGSIHESNRDIRRTNSIVKSWHLSFQYVRNKHPAAARLLSLMCLFDRQDIPEVLVAKRYKEKTSAAIMPSPHRQPWWKRFKRMRRSRRTVECRATAQERTTTFVDDWRVLNNLMLIKTSIEGDTFSMHRLIQYTTKRWLEINNELGVWTAKFVDLMVHCFPKHDYDNWRLCQYLFPHAQHVADYRPLEKAAQERWASLVHDIAQFATYAGNYSAAEKLGRIAMDTIEELKGERNEDTLRCVYDLGSTLTRVHRNLEAEVLFRRALDGRITLLGPDHLDTLESIRALGDALDALKKWEEADALADRMIEGFARIYGPTHAETQALLAGLTFGYVMSERFDQAEKMYHRFCASGNQEAGGESVDNIWRLALLLNMQGKPAEAEVLLLQVSQAWETKHGLEHDDTIRSLNALGDALTKQGKLEEATKHYRRVLDVFTDLGGKAREEALTSLDNLALVLSRQGALEEAETTSRQAIDETTKLLGYDHADTYIRYHTLGEVLTQQRRFQEALEMYEKAYRGTFDRGGADHPDTVEFFDDFNAAKNRLVKEAEDVDCSSTGGAEQYDVGVAETQISTFHSACHEAGGLKGIIVG